jgi:cysteine desulfurase
LTHCQRSDEVIAGDLAHIVQAELGGAAGLAGVNLRQVRNDEQGLMDLDEIKSKIRQPGGSGPRTALICVENTHNYCNGAAVPASFTSEVAAIAHEAGALLHVDAAQAVGKVPVDVEASGIDLLSLTGHKMYGPKGCGALVVRKKTELAPLICGGGQERGLRSGTLNVPGIVGLGEACAVCQAEMAAEAARLGALRDRLLGGLTSGLDGVSVNGSMAHRLPHNLHVSFAGVDGASLVIGIGDIAVSTGSACSSASEAPSHVLQALGGEAAASASIRFGLGRLTTGADIDYAIEKFVTVVRHLQEKAPAV